MGMEIFSGTAEFEEFENKTMQNTWSKGKHLEKTDKKNLREENLGLRAVPQRLRNKCF